MIDILLSTPGFYFYLAFVLILLLPSLLTRQTDPPLGEPRATALTTGRMPAMLRRQPVATWTEIPCGGALRTSSATARPFPDVEDTISARYAARLEPAIRKIRIGPFAWAWPT